MVKYLFITVITCIGLCSCNWETKKASLETEEIHPKAFATESIDLGFLAEINHALFESLSNKNDSVEIIYFDADCSICIAKFVNSIKNSKIKKDFTYLYIIAANDNFTIEYYLKENGIELHQNEHLILNKNYEFETYNPLINVAAIPRIVTDSKSVIASIEYLYDY
ncbi:MAG TPA: hypothetical protein DG754_00220 [Bacteroidales bacterium]|jgi:hypothetical protein|nr:hypothetical protein [Bacteroidales bacterium]